MNFYNDNDAFCYQWLRNLIAEGQLPQGRVDERSIVELSACDVAGYPQVHLFAGIGGWPLALEMAGWPTTRPVWTGSCPCQPFSSAGKHKGAADERHLWPEFRRLIAECRPPVIFGEQVASKDGREWLAGVRADLEALGYAVGVADLCAASQGAPHIRQRLFWVADANTGRKRLEPGSSDEICSGRTRNTSFGPWRGGTIGGLADADNTRSQGRDSRRNGADQWSPWSPSVALPCLDGKARRIKPGTFPLAHGVPNRVGRLRGYGNAIVPQVAAAFVKAFLEL